MKCFKGERADFVINALPNFEPVKRFEDGCDMRKFRSRDNSSSERVLDALDAVKLIFRKIEVERVAVVEFGMNKRWRRCRQFCGQERGEYGFH